MRPRPCGSLSRLSSALVPPLPHSCLQVWTYRGRVAFVLSITEKGMPVVDGIKLQRLRQLVLGEPRGLACCDAMCCTRLSGCAFCRRQWMTGVGPASPCAGQSALHTTPLPSAGIMTRRPGPSNSNGALAAMAAAGCAGMPGGSTHGGSGVIINIRKVGGGRKPVCACAGREEACILSAVACLPVCLPMPGPTRCCDHCMPVACCCCRVQVRGEVHHDRRLHQLMLQEEVNQVGFCCLLPLRLCACSAALAAFAGPHCGRKQCWGFFQPFIKATSAHSPAPASHQSLPIAVVTRGTVADCGRGAA